MRRDLSSKSSDILLLLRPVSNAKYCDEYVFFCLSVCLSLCPLTYLEKYVAKLPHFFLLPVAVARSFPAALRYVMYFRFYG